MKLDSKLKVTTNPHDEIEITTSQGMLIRIKDFEVDVESPYTIRVDVRPRGMVGDARLKSETLQDGHLAYSGVFGMSEKES